MKRAFASTILGLGFLFAGCTVHHYHHHGEGGAEAKKGAHDKQAGHHCPCSRSLPAGHPPVDPHHGMKGHGMKGHGMKGHGMKNHPADGAHAGHHGKLPPNVAAYHDAFAAVWHLEDEVARHQGACQAAPNWVELAAKIGSESSTPEYDAAVKNLVARSQAVVAACSAKGSATGDVQVAMKSAHDALHALFQHLFLD